MITMRSGALHTAAAALALYLLAHGLPRSCSAQQPGEATIPDPPYATAPLTICSDRALLPNRTQCSDVTQRTSRDDQT